MLGLVLGLCEMQANRRWRHHSTLMNIQVARHFHSELFQKPDNKLNFFPFMVSMHTAGVIQVDGKPLLPITRLKSTYLCLSCLAFHRTTQNTNGTASPKSLANRWVRVELLVLF